MQKTADPSRIGRFNVLSSLGRGAQGNVFLAEDSRLKRKVAIKTLHVQSTSSAEHAQQVKALLDEAQIVSQLSHPGIVTLYDAGEEGGVPYLVFEYVQGKTLSALLKESGPLSTARAVDITIQILKAVGYAHQKGVMHRDLKPGNIMTAGDTARVMDFGIAQLISSEPSDDDVFAGTPAYMAPEYISDKLYTPRSDLFALGMVLYEMLAGRPAIQGRNVFEILHRIVHEPIVAPSQLNAQIDERLDGLVLKSLTKAPEERFESAAKMEDALYIYLNPETDTGDAGAEGGKQGTLEFLLRRMRHKSDFPALSSTISTVNKAAASETERLTALSSCILKDFALTNKLLKLVNTAYYGQFGGTVSTISRAVVIMGFDHIRQIAITLMLFEHLQNKAQAAQLKDEVLASYFSGILGRELTAKAALRDAEEVFVCSVFHGLGKLLTAFYFHEEYQEINKLMQARAMDETHASNQVLGISFEELGMGVAKVWHFPDKLIQSMRRLQEERVKRPATEEARLRTVSELATGLCNAVREAEPEKRRTRINMLAARYGESMGISTESLTAVIQSAATELAKDSSQLGFKPNQSPLFTTVLELARSAQTDARQPGAADDPLQTVIQDATLLTRDLTLDQRHAAVPGSGTPTDSQAILTAGIQDITNTLVGSYELNDILRIILETMYRGMGFTRVVLCVRDPASNTLRGRFGFGQDVDQIIKRGFTVALTPSRDAFYAAVSNGADIYIENINADKIREHIPEWYRKLVPAQSLVLFPVLVNKKPVGLFYGDSDRQGALHFESGELNLLKTLRNQAVLAIRQRN